VGELVGELKAEEELLSQVLRWLLPPCLALLLPGCCPMLLLHFPVFLLLPRFCC